MRLRRGSFLPERVMGRIDPRARPRRGDPDPGLQEMQDRLRQSGANLPGSDPGLGFASRAGSVPSGSPAADAMRDDLGFQ